MNLAWSASRVGRPCGSKRCIRNHNREYRVKCHANPTWVGAGARDAMHCSTGCFQPLRFSRHLPLVLIPTPEEPRRGRSPSPHSRRFPGECAGGAAVTCKKRQPDCCYAVTFSEALRLEMQSRGNLSVNAATVAPFFDRLGGFDSPKKHGR